MWNATLWQSNTTNHFKIPSLTTELTLFQIYKTQHWNAEKTTKRFGRSQLKVTKSKNWNSSWNLVNSVERGNCEFVEAFQTSNLSTFLVKSIQGFKLTYENHVHLRYEKFICRQTRRLQLVHCESFQIDQAWKLSTIEIGLEKNNPIF